MNPKTVAGLLTLLVLTSAACSGTTSDASGTATTTSVIGSPTTAESVAEPIDVDVDYGADAADGDSRSEPLLDVWAPENADGAPVMVLLDGFPPSRQRTAEMAAALASQGFVVLNADWHADLSLATGVQYQGACLVRFARANAERYGGDPAQVIVVGYSAGGSIAALLALNGDAISGQCDQDEALSPVPDAIIGLAGGYEYIVLDSPEHGFGAQVFADDPELWAMMNPYEHLDRASGVTALLIHGENDSTVSPGSTERFAAALREGGGEVSSYVLTDVGHGLTHEAYLHQVADQITAWLSRE